MQHAVHSLISLFFKVLSEIQLCINYKIYIKQSIAISKGTGVLSFCSNAKQYKPLTMTPESRFASIINVFDVKASLNKNRKATFILFHGQV